jgi:hypothetical protein
MQEWEASGGQVSPDLVRIACLGEGCQVADPLRKMQELEIRFCQPAFPLIHHRPVVPVSIHQER